MIDAGRVDAGPPDAGTPDAGLAVIRLQQLRLDAGDGELVSVELLQLNVPGHEPAFAQWMPAPSRDGGPRPTLVVAKPYDSVGWTGDPRDTAWSAQPAGLFPDRFGPQGADGGSIVCMPLTVEQQLGEAGLYRNHGISVLAVYGRFYAGGSIQNDVDDMKAGFEFLRLEPSVDRTRIGIQGGSWGGFLAMYGAMNAPSELRPIVGAALYPLSDFDAQYTYVTQTMPARFTSSLTRDAYRSFFNPYLLRINLTTGGAPGTGTFTGFDFAGITGRLQTPFLIIHEDWDTLVDIAESERIVAAFPSSVTPLWIRHDGPPPSWDALSASHGPQVSGALGAASFTFVWSTLLRRLSDVPAVIVPYQEATFRQLLEWGRDRSRAGTSHATLAVQLLGLLDPRVFMYELGTGQIEAGSVFVSRVVNAVWGTTTTPQSIAATLGPGLPP